MKAEIDKDIATLIARADSDEVSTPVERVGDGGTIIKEWEIGGNTYYETYTVDKVEIEVP